MISNYISNSHLIPVENSEFSNLPSYLLEIIQSDLGENFTIIIGSPQDLVFDRKGLYCCKLKCPNYATRCYCPPFSNKLKKKALSYNTLLIFAKTYDFSELKHFKNYPEHYNEDYLFKKRVFVRRWVQNDFYSKIKQLNKFFKNYHPDFFLSGGFSLKKCSKCYEPGKEMKNDIASCGPMPSPEALGIDLKKSLDKFSYFLDFGVKTRMSKVSMVFLNLSTHSDKRYIFNGKFDKPFQKINEKNLSILKTLQREIKKVQFVLIDTSEIIDFIDVRYSFLKFWKKAILWKSELKSKKKMKKEIHEICFLNNFYYSLDFFVDDIIDSEFSFDGIEFLD